MLNKLQTYFKLQTGQTVLLTLIVLAGVILTVTLLLSGSLNYFIDSSHTVDSSVALNLAEAGIDKAVASLNAAGNSYTGETDTPLGNGTFSTTITPKDPSTNIIQSTGYTPNRTKPKAKKTITIQISKGAGISFVYGLLTGNGGITMGNGSGINGSIYSNGNIIGGNNETITGDAYVAGGTQPNADQQTDCSSPNCSDYIFGKNVSGNNQLDIAQSFTPLQNAVINKVSLKLKKTGTPPNVTVRILADNGGKPDKGNVLTSGTLYANLVTTQYGFIDVSFSSSPSLSVNTKYWIMVDTSSDNSNYWSWSMDTLQGYTRGSPMWVNDWSTGNPQWAAINGDLGFKTWMGGVPTKIQLNNGSVIQGNVHANSLDGFTVNKDAYYQSITGSVVVNGTKYPNSVDPVPAAMPISDANITEWKGDAEDAGVYTGNLSGCPSKIGPGKYVGNFITGNNCTITVVTPFWLTGDLTFGNSTIFKMDPSLGASSGVMIVDGVTTFQNSDDLRGSGANGSYLTILSTYDSQAHGGTIAINTGNSSITGILYAPYGILTLANNATFKEAVAWQINMGTGTLLTYDSGLISTFFSAGPSGAFSVIRGTYQSK
jgi:hypothetical protein